MNKVYFIGGSPCSGKSTVAEWISKQYGLYYFKVDDFLDDYTEKGKHKQKEICKKQGIMTPEQTWMREPDLQNKEELKWYREIFEFIMEDLEKAEKTDGIITEGAAFLPGLMKQAGVDKNHFISMTPTKEFQVSHYRERPWVSYVLEGCSDKEKAFENWMERDALFGSEVRRQCAELGYKSILVDGTSDEVGMRRFVETSFQLDNLEG